jgi:release factor glutamine methyltransferase
MRERGVDSPRLCAEMLLAHTLKCERLHLYMHADRPATAEERDLLRALTTRALAHEPVQYLVGEGWFFSLPFTVDARVLIPRPATETLVEHALQCFRAAARPAAGDDAAPITAESPLIADVCTGSACIAVAMAKQLPGARVLATDVSAAALEVARINAARHAVDARIEFRQGDLLAPLHDPPGAMFDAILSNPPYIPDHEWNTPGMVGRNVKGQEPELALRGGEDGLMFVRPLIEAAPALLKPGGLLMIEFADSTAADVLRLAQAQPMLRETRILKDCDDLPRVLSARRT